MLCGEDARGDRAPKYTVPLRAGGKNNMQGSPSANTPRGASGGEQNKKSSYKVPTPGPSGSACNLLPYRVTARETCRRAAPRGGQPAALMLAPPRPSQAACIQTCMALFYYNTLFRPAGPHAAPTQAFGGPNIMPPAYPRACRNSCFPAVFQTLFRWTRRAVRFGGAVIPRDLAFQIGRV